MDYKRQKRVVSS